MNESAYAGRVAVVGYPNVGKSTLVNRLVGGRDAIVHETAGVTRDRHEIDCEWNGVRFRLIDTGGVELGSRSQMSRAIRAQVEAAIGEADLVLLVVDAAAGVTAADQEIAELLRPAKVPIIVVANKLDDWKRRDEVLEFHALGLGEPFPVSAVQGIGSGDLLDRVVEELREHGSGFDLPADDEIVRIGVFGRRNVGKSTLVNAMTGLDRVIVSDIAGTTRDPVDTHFRFEAREILLVDTAGLQRGRKNKEDLQFYSEVRALQAAERADVALLLIDASEGVTEGDLAIADKLRERNCAVLVALSKWDIQNVELELVRDRIAAKLRQRPEVVTLSSITGRNVTKLLRKAIELRDRCAQRVPTSRFNRYLEDLVASQPTPSDGKGRRLKMLYGTQYGVLPPRFRITVNDRGLVTRSWAYFVENRIRDDFGLSGCPVIIEFRSR